MKISTLVENTSLSSEFKNVHGLSFYIETENHKILLDLGPNDFFIHNAEKLNIDIAKVDTVIISHGHFDHGGGLGTFLQKNKTAKIFIHKTAFEDYRIKVLVFSKYIGIDSSLKEYGQIVSTDDEYVIDTGLTLFSGVTERECFSNSNKALYVKNENGLVRDDFRHEQNLIINENGKYTLLSGCAHNGIINIQKKAEEIIGTQLDTVISGFHLFNPATKKSENKDLIIEIANIMKTKKTKYYTCHCTGLTAMQTLKSVLGEQIEYLSAGYQIEI